MSHKERERFDYIAKKQGKNRSEMLRKWIRIEWKALEAAGKV